MGQTIPASQFVAINPGVVGAGGEGVILQAMVLTTSTRVPVGTVASFPNAGAWPMSAPPASISRRIMATS